MQPMVIGILGAAALRGDHDGTMTVRSSNQCCKTCHCVLLGPQHTHKETEKERKMFLYELPCKTSLRLLFYFDFIGERILSH
jgi:hypothetical protein